MSSASAAAPAEQQRSVDVASLLGKFAPIIFLLLVMAFFSYMEPGFRTRTNLLNIVRAVSFFGILGVGMTFVILTAGIDLSVGSALAFCGIVCASAAKGSRALLTGKDDGGINVLYAFLAALGVGLLIGLIHGVFIAYLKVPAFIVTLGGLGAWRGATLLWSNGQPISNFSSDFTEWGKGSVGEVPIPVIFFVGMGLIAHIVLKYTRYGRWIYALGGNAEAARLSGLNTKMITTSVYVISGMCAGVSAFLLTSRLNSAEQVAGQNYELQAIASVVIGGTSLFGGAGGVVGTLIGAVLIGVLNNGLVQMNVSPYYQPIVVGVIIVLSVYVDQVVKTRRR
ncbi:MAG: ABC transporter permease [Chloroflexota bacterium]|jgi:ribose/xylose/arabinose/galactoside ABC-type transport system permease subunit|nr:ABC transporter permease [Chloroflexota bacterium]